MNAENKKPYQIKGEHESIIVETADYADLAADGYHKVPGGTLCPQTTPFGGIAYNGNNKQVIPIVDVNEGPADLEQELKTTNVVGTFQQSKQEASPDNVAPPGLVAPGSHPEMPPSSFKRPLMKVTLDSPMFGKVVIPALESLLGEGCTVLVTDTSDGFSFIPPVSDTPFTVMFEGDKKGSNMFYCGQTFSRPSLNEQYLLLIHADK